MAGKKKLETKNSKLKTAEFHKARPYAFRFTLLVCTLLFSGCGPESEKAKALQVDNILKTPAEEKREKLLKTIDRRFRN